MGWRQEVASRWPTPRRTRHVWITRGDDLPPLQGLVLDWKRHAYKWSALVVFVDDTEPQVVVQQWITAEQLKPVPAHRVDLPRKGEPKPAHWS